MDKTTHIDAVLSIKDGQIGIMPTDTIYGVVASALNKDSVERVYAVRGRDLEKPCIILIADKEEVKKFNVKISDVAQNTMDTYWPGAVSIIFPCTDKKLKYLHRGTNSLAFRVPDPSHKELIDFLKQTGPLIAPSANLAGNPPAKTIEEAEDMFPATVDFYIDGGLCEGAPSTVVSVTTEKLVLLRSGAVPFSVEEDVDM